MRTLRILAISGSLRAVSSNTAVLRAARTLAPENFEITLYGGLGDLPRLEEVVHELGIQLQHPDQQAERAEEKQRRDGDEAPFGAHEARTLIIRRKKAVPLQYHESLIGVPLEVLSGLCDAYRKARIAS